MQYVSFFVKAAVQPKERPRMGKSGHFYTPKKTHDSENTIGYAAKTAMKGREPFTGYLKVEIDFLVRPPESWSMKRKQAAMAGDSFPTKNDLDNQIKSVLDSMNDIVYVDDRRIVMLKAIRSYGDEDNTHIAVTEIDSADDLLETE
jgi:Holliday junction resolvase RusA-like endonuclease